MKSNEAGMDKYQPEIIMAVLGLIYNIVLIVVCGKTVVELYKLSGSFHCLWALAMLLFLSKVSFIRD